MGVSVRCFLCGRLIEDEGDLVMGNVWKGLVWAWFGGVQERAAFHAGCWDSYRRRERRQNILAAVLILGAVLAALAYALIRLSLRLF